MNPFPECQAFSQMEGLKEELNMVESDLTESDNLLPTTTEYPVLHPLAVRNTRCWLGMVACPAHMAHAHL